LAAWTDLFVEFLKINFENSYFNKIKYSSNIQYVPSQKRKRNRKRKKEFYFEKKILK